MNDPLIISIPFAVFAAGLGAGGTALAVLLDPDCAKRKLLTITIGATLTILATATVLAFGATA